MVAPCLIGGRDTMSLISGESLVTDEDLKGIKSLELMEANVLKDSYLELRYRVNN